MTVIMVCGMRIEIGSQDRYSTVRFGAKYRYYQKQRDKNGKNNDNILRFLQKRNWETLPDVDS